MAMWCPKCHAEYENNIKQCKYCNVNLVDKNIEGILPKEILDDPAISEIFTESGKCPNCKEDITSYLSTDSSKKKITLICPFCHKKIGKETHGFFSTIYVKKEMSESLILWIFAGIAVILLGYFFFAR